MSNGFGTPQRQWLQQSCLVNCAELREEFYDRKQMAIPSDVQELIDQSHNSENDQSEYDVEVETEDRD